MDTKDTRHQQAHADRLALIARPFPRVRLPETHSHTLRWAGVCMNAVSRGPAEILKEDNYADRVHHRD